MASRSKVAIAPAALCGLGAAMILLAMPVGLVETVVASSGLSEAWPAAAPPLGWKARLLLAGFGALMAIGFVWAGSRGSAPSYGKENGGRDGFRGVKKMGFALSKLSWLARGRNGGSSKGARPALRRADAHPDAPARTPIFASRDFGGLEIFSRSTPALSPQPDSADAEPSVVLALPRFAAPLAEEEEPAVCAHQTPEQPAQEPVYAEFEEIAEPTAVPPHGAEAAREVALPPAAPFTVAQLTARLERGLAQRQRTERTNGPAAGVLADMPVERAVPVREHVEDDVDQALHAALGALRAMVERTR